MEPQNTQMDVDKDGLDSVQMAYWLRCYGALHVGTGFRKKVYELALAHEFWKSRLTTYSNFEMADVRFCCFFILTNSILKIKDWPRNCQALSLFTCST